MREQSDKYNIMQQVLPYPRELGGGGGVTKFKSAESAVLVLLVGTCRFDYEYVVEYE